MIVESLRGKNPVAVVQALQFLVEKVEDRDGRMSVRGHRDSQLWIGVDWRIRRVVYPPQLVLAH